MQYCCTGDGAGVDRNAIAIFVRRADLDRFLDHVLTDGVSKRARQKGNILDSSGNAD